MELTTSSGRVNPDHFRAGRVGWQPSHFWCEALAWQRRLAACNFRFGGCHKFYYMIMLNLVQW